METKPTCINCGYPLSHPKGSRFCSIECMKDFQDKNNRKK